jgi:hypothetical protein
MSHHHKKKPNDPHLCDCQTILYLKLLDKAVCRKSIQEDLVCHERIQFSVKVMQGSNTIYIC